MLVLVSVPLSSPNLYCCDAYSLLHGTKYIILYITPFVNIFIFHLSITCSCCILFSLLYILCVSTQHCIMLWTIKFNSILIIENMLHTFGPFCRLASTLNERGAVVDAGGMGAPTIGKERPKGFETFHNVQTVQELYSVGGYKNGKLQNTGNFRILFAKSIVKFLPVAPQLQFCNVCLPCMDV